MKLVSKLELKFKGNSQSFWHDNHLPRRQQATVLSGTQPKGHLGDVVLSCFSPGIKHRSTEHNSSLMVSESEFESDQDTLFSRERMERGSLNGSARNGASFGYCAKDR